jgi:hypothetical protein
MYDVSDPRASLAPAAPAANTATHFCGAEYGKFYETDPQERSANSRTWYVRGQNFIVAYSETESGAIFDRIEQPDEYVVLIPNAETAVEITTRERPEAIPGYSLTFLPRGYSSVKITKGGRIVRLFTTKSKDLAAKCLNAQSYATPHPNIPPFEPWPEPTGGLRLRWYSLDVPPEPGRFGRIFRCTTFMVNYIDPQVGPRDITKLSPHHHDDFEQCSLALEGAFTHHMRWPWTTNMNSWRDDEHTYCGSPSVCVIPPPAIHTSRGMEAGVNQLIDIFSPPRIDFSEKPGWVLNAKDYPMPTRS